MTVGTRNLKTKKADWKKNKSWKELPPAARIGTIVIGAAQLAFLTAAQRDLSRRPAEQIRGSKMFWRLATLVNFIGPGCYFAFGRKGLPAVTRR
ncbi:hypothetical protein ARGLB_083_01230 [Arthrobacter globiformis NBRC 12137]|uniref:Cardiolipin synthase N-terminal domain-containing protein n=1 Tax=Arthrobacter globiformis (strain ATCC 8010 / DSM 20124 / JCM 1332 / NBRC 12137 / NCIMB 8907 / NRRL B-2979 / 168) TaxID=1077972 RepID=H0QQY2_ARTG1|nr:hypothetical protein ARGLB_083_01230 [Arthrobacter globiformis NBRC 12137]